MAEEMGGPEVPEVASAEPRICSRLRRLPGQGRMWRAPIGVRITLPVAVDLWAGGAEGGVPRWSGSAVVDAVNGQLALTRVEIAADRGLDVERLQSTFRWRTPLDIVGLWMPAVKRAGLDPYAVEVPVNNFPEAARLGFGGRHRISDEFLEEISTRYLTIGRGYAATMAPEYDVSPRTVVSWIEKARARGILTRVPAGGFGGRLVPLEERTGGAEAQPKRK